MEEKIKEILKPFSKENYFTLTKKIGRRNEFLFSLGETKFLPKEMLWESSEYILFVEGLTKENEIKILENLKTFE